VTTLGLPTVRILLHRAIWRTAQRHPALALIQREERSNMLSTRTSIWRHILHHVVPSLLVNGVAPLISSSTTCCALI
jgi:hypothetical protein